MSGASTEKFTVKFIPLINPDLGHVGHVQYIKVNIITILEIFQSSCSEDTGMACYLILVFTLVFCSKEIIIQDLLVKVV